MFGRRAFTRLPKSSIHPLRLLSKATSPKPQAAKAPAGKADLASRINEESIRGRILRLNARLPKFLHRYTNTLGTAPVTHVTSFLLLHELTAVVPLFGLAALFHYTDWLPAPFVEAKIVTDGVEKWGRYARRKGWLGEDEQQEADVIAKDHAKKAEHGEAQRPWGQGEAGVRLLVEFATAYAITKVLLPLRIMLSLSATPWFARWTVTPVTNGFKRMFGKGKAVARGTT